MISTVELPLKADTSAAPALLEQLAAVQGKPCHIDAKACQAIGAVCVNILISARQSWRRQNLAFELVDADHLIDDLTLLGVVALLLQPEVAQ